MSDINWLQDVYYPQSCPPPLNAAAKTCVVYTLARSTSTTDLKANHSGMSSPGVRVRVRVRFRALKMNEATHVKRMQWAQAKAEGFQAQCSKAGCLAQAKPLFVSGVVEKSSQRHAMDENNSQTDTSTPMVGSGLMSSPARSMVRNLVPDRFFFVSFFSSATSAVT